MLTSRGLPRDSTCVLKAEPCKLDIKIRELGILFIRLPIGSLFKLAIMTKLSIFVLIQRQKVQRHHDLIKAHAMRKTTFIRQRATLQLI